MLRQIWNLCWFKKKKNFCIYFFSIEWISKLKLIYNFIYLYLIYIFYIGLFKYIKIKIRIPVLLCTIHKCMLFERNKMLSLQPFTVIFLAFSANNVSAKISIPGSILKFILGTFPIIINSWCIKSSPYIFFSNIVSLRNTPCLQK